ncbi:2451_t:CDS:2 [Entrophospora sp. SA101]|nr:2451_t:CDS:2 [Entrophospora sp. SA101]
MEWTLSKKIQNQSMNPDDCHGGDDGSSRESIPTLDEWKELWKS